MTKKQITIWRAKTGNKYYLSFRDLLTFTLKHISILNAETSPIMSFPFGLLSSIRTGMTIPRESLFFHKV